MYSRNSSIRIPARQSIARSSQIVRAAAVAQVREREENARAALR